MNRDGWNVIFGMLCFIAAILLSDLASPECVRVGILCYFP